MKNIISVIFTLLLLVLCSGMVNPSFQEFKVNDTTVTARPELPDAFADSAGGGRTGIAFSAETENPWMSRIHYSGRSFTLVYLLIAAILFSIGTMIVLLTVILVNRRRMEREQELRQYLKEAYQGLIIDYLFGVGDISKFNEIASDRFRREVLIDEMIDVAVNLKGGSEKKLDMLYYELGLHKDSLRRAYSMRWHIKVKGFRELAFMNIRDANEEIYRCLNSKNEILRMEAQIALTRLSDDNPFDFLYRLKRPFSLWEQISLHELLVQHTVPVPNFRQWLDSPNDTVVLFSLRMIREFRQTDAERKLLKCFDHPSEDIRFLAIQVAGDIGLKASLEILKRKYKYEVYRNGLEIVRTMGKIPDVKMLGFLKLILDKEDDIQLQIEATKAIENIGEEGIAALNKLMDSEYKNYKIIIRHVLDKRIN